MCAYLFVIQGMMNGGGGGTNPTYVNIDLCKNELMQRVVEWTTCVSQNHITTGSHSASLSWCQTPPSGTRDQFFPSFFCINNCRFLDVGRPLWREDGSVIYSYSWFWAFRAVTLGSGSRRTHDRILLSHLRLPQPGGPGPHICIPQEQGGSVIPLGTGFPFCHLLRLAGLWWRYSIPPPLGVLA
jgi:hypothetical protein